MRLDHLRDDVLAAQHAVGEMQQVLRQRLDAWAAAAFPHKVGDVIEGDFSRGMTRARIVTVHGAKITERGDLYVVCSVAPIKKDGTKAVMHYRAWSWMPEKV